MEERRYASRKFLIAVALIAATMALFVFDRIDAVVWADVTKWIVGLYYTGNVATWLTEAIRSKN
jgi:hypothetical protein